MFTRTSDSRAFHPGHSPHPGQFPLGYFWLASQTVSHVFRAQDRSDTLSFGNVAYIICVSYFAIKYALYIKFYVKLKRKNTLGYIIKRALVM